MKILVLGYIALVVIFLWKVVTGGIESGSSPIITSDNEDGWSLFDDDSLSSASVTDDDYGASMLSDDSPARGMWDVTSTYYGAMHDD